MSTINPDDYLDRLKVKQPKMKTHQEIFDTIIRGLFHQQVPCVRDYDPSHLLYKRYNGKDEQCDDDDDKSEEENYSDVVNFNMHGHLSPLLMHFTRDDIRCLKKVIGYDELQTLRSDDIYWAASLNLRNDYTAREMIAEIGENRKEVALKIIDLMGLRGIDNIGIRLTCMMCDKHLNWAYDYLTARDQVVKGSRSYNPHVSTNRTDLLGILRRVFQYLSISEVSRLDLSVFDKP